MARRITPLIISLSLLLFACTKSSYNSSTGGTTIDQAADWHVTLFTSNGKDSTTEFDGYLFVFASTNVLTAKRGALSTTGTWSQGATFNIDLGAKSDTNKPLGNLTGNWTIISVTSTDIKLKNDAAPGAPNLTFTKN
jgi:hypothetical protein